MGKSTDIFGEPTSRRAPRELNEGEWRELRRWAEERAPWITRGALGSLTPLEEYVDECLAHFRTSRTMRPNWVDSAINWIRRDERRRLERMAAAGSEQAKLALRDPAAWRAQFDRVARVAKVAATAEPEILRPREPAQGARVFQLGARSAG
jgi:hypothetical protein